MTASQLKVMIAKPSIAFNDFAGTAKEVTARNVNGRNILSVRAKHNRIVTPAQAIKRNQLSKISRAYKQLTDSQMNAWGVLAEHLKGISTLGKSASMTAHNAFVRINSNRLMAGMPLLDDAPDYTAAVPKVEYSDFWVTPKMIVFTGLVQPNPNCRLVIRMSKTVSSGVSSGWGNTVIITAEGISDWGELDLTDEYFEVVGQYPVAGQKVFLELSWMDTQTGFSGESVMLSSICREESAQSGETFVARSRVVTKDIKESTGCDDIDMELSEGSTIMSIDSHYGNNTGVASCEIILKETKKNIPDFDACIVGRSSNHENGYMYRPQLFLVWMRNNFLGSEITFVHRGGQYNKQDNDVFGTSPVFK